MLILEDELASIMEEYGIALNGVFHIGAHKCEEMPIYKKLGLEPTDVVWIDAMDTYVFLAKKWGIPHIYNAVVTDKDDDVISFNISNNNQSSSILELETHLLEHPDIHYVDTIQMNTITVDTFFKRNTLDPKKYNMWTIDIQGAELLALKGGVESLAHADLLYLEVNERELYKGCALIGEIDTFLEVHGFKRIRTEMTRHGWGDAVYIKSRGSRSSQAIITAFDIGANDGSWTKANINRFNKIVSIEASPTTFERLVNSSNSGKTVLLNYAVCNNNGEDITFYMATGNPALSTMNKDWLTCETSRFYNEPYTQTTCKTITIDNLIKMYGLPDLIKIDVESGEYECISSLTQKVKMLCFEWASEVNNITFKCLDYLFTIGFTQFYIQGGDHYTFRPNENDFYDINITKNKLLTTKEKIDWGMIWSK